MIRKSFFIQRNPGVSVYPMALEEVQKQSMFPVGGENTAYADCFGGASYLKMLGLKQVATCSMAFGPGWRNNCISLMPKLVADRCCRLPPVMPGVRSGGAPTASRSLVTWPTFPPA